jgi:hypothetical protein
MTTLLKALLALIVISAIALGFSLCSAIVADILNKVAQALMDGANTLASISGEVLKDSVIVLALSLTGFIMLSGKK